MGERKPTGYPSVDRPWMKYYGEEAVNAALPACTIYDYLYEQNKAHTQDAALSYFDKLTTYGQLFSKIDEAARAFPISG